MKKRAYILTILLTVILFTFSTSAVHAQEWCLPGCNYGSAYVSGWAFCFENGCENNGGGACPPNPPGHEYQHTERLLVDGEEVCHYEWWRGLDCSVCGGGGCFVGETQITTPHGKKAIENIAIGEDVVSMNTETEELITTQVENVYSITREGYYEITVELPDGEEKVLKVTGEHPLYVKKDQTYTNLFKNTVSNVKLLLQRFFR